jgi:hypothetical protein
MAGGSASVASMRTGAQSSRAPRQAGAVIALNSGPLSRAAALARGLLYLPA